MANSKRFAFLWMTCGLVGLTALLAAAPGEWAYWRGPNADGMALGDAPTRWSDTQGIHWKITVPGSGLSSPVVWGDRLFLTSAVPTSGQPAKGTLVEHRFVVLCYNRATG